MVAEDFIQSYLQDCLDLMGSDVFEGELNSIVYSVENNRPSTYLECIFLDLKYDITGITLASRVGDVSKFFEIYPSAEIRVSREGSCNPLLSKYTEEIKDLPDPYLYYLRDYLILTDDYNLAKQELDYMRAVHEDGTEDLDSLLRLRIRCNLDGTKVVTTGRDLLDLDLDMDIRLQELSDGFTTLLEVEKKRIQEK